MNLAEQLDMQEVTQTIDTHNAIAQIKMLHAKADKYITVATIDKDKKYQQRHMKLEELISNVDKLISLNRNTYISVNEFYLQKRSVATLRRINALYVDLDLADKSYEINDDELNFAIKILENEYFNKTIPQASMIVKTGRGLHLYWKLEDLPEQGLTLWTLVQQKLIERLSDFNESFRLLKVDEAVKDCTRILRLAGTINTKNNTICKLESLYEENVYRLDNLIEEYFEELKIIKENKINKVKIKNKKERKIVSIYNLYTLHHARLLDIEKLQGLRNDDKTIDYRRRMCFLYRYYSCLFTHDKELALNNTLSFNSKFAESLTEKEVLQASAAAETAYENWLTNKAEDFLKPIWNSEKGTYNIKGYNYSNTSLIKELEITEEEQMQMSTIFSKKIKLEKKNIKRKKDRRNANNLTKKQQELEDIYVEVIKLRKLKLKNKIISDKLGLEKKTLERYITKLKKEGRL